MRVSAERGASILTGRDWMWTEGYWRPTIATVEANPAVTPGNYTLAEALAIYNYELEED
jgi:hypothetical protein